MLHNFTYNIHRMLRALIAYLLMKQDGYISFCIVSIEDCNSDLLKIGWNQLLTRYYMAHRQTLIKIYTNLPLFSFPMRCAPSRLNSEFCLHYSIMFMYALYYLKMNIKIHSLRVKVHSYKWF